ncbi:spermidine/putrescine ABC transporter substrate-binding protein [Streptomyces antimycoticus]|uniref:Spermidine/putrescine ABC transporter substrate-binding protein n=3 Tax=Streptomyces TaxID=1883 RepID=A0ABD5JJD6_9ACTN|nr:MULTISPECIES: spermidine/putrescine ABC transporter substrate-binding protein [Streptomyces]MEE4588530.1 spermidine/putrescine ABC transporter substrate-binding protein [Streptomyces sp. DSM 41602]KUL43636.1 ABC transporter substrate-binding protein [Streptomyces violaceusniger]RSS37398.1 spermidine/putrescine ABC transporter substrate-binding protein [Streptomyces sp. WAC05858]WJD96896.1 spermidine/putrescine ABC transporter substrate-binding protein [Streptomyces antimycoticus]WTA84361.1 
MEARHESESLSPPQVAAIRRSMTSGRMALTRRSLLRAGGAGAIAVGGLGALGGCGIPPAGRTEVDNASDDHSAEEKRLAFSNWTEYMDVGKGGRHPTLDAFQRRTGIKVKYTEDINDNVEFFGKIKPQLAAGQDTGRDLICVTDWLAARMIRLGWIQPLDPAQLPHAYTNLSKPFRTPDWDPGRAHSYPWTGIPAVIAYNKKATGGRKVTSVSQLLEDPGLKGRVGLLTEMRDTVGLTLLDMGKNPETVTADDYDAAIARLQKASDRGQVRRFTGNDYTGDLTKGDIAACMAWAGDLIQLQADNPEIEFAIPDAGYMTATDNLLVPNKARHKRNAERLIDYFYEPKVAAKIAAYINYVCPVDGVREELAKIDKALADNPLILPDEEMAAKSHSFRSLSSDEEAAFEDKFAKLTGA